MYSRQATKGDNPPSPRATADDDPPAPKATADDEKMFCG